MRDRASQQSALAALGQQALSGGELEELLGAAAAVAARELEADQVAVLERTRDGRGMLGRAGAGLPDGVIGGVLPLDPSTLAADLASESSLAAEIEGFGRVETHSGAAGHFTIEDSEFLQGVANVLGAAAQRAGYDDLVRDSEAQFRELADTTPALMWMTDAEGDVTFVNRAWQRFTGGESHTGVTFAATAHPDDREVAQQLWNEASARRQEFRCEYRLRHASGGYRWVLEVGTPRFSGGDFVGYVGTATDIHERKTMEEALRESEAGFRELADTAPAMMWTTDVHGLITFVNQGWLRFTGTT